MQIASLDSVWQISWMPKQGLLIDEICFRHLDIDDTKAILDLSKTRDVHCRNKDWAIPKLTPKILCTNWKREVFWPADARLPEHKAPIDRRHRWVDIVCDLKVFPPDATDDFAVCVSQAPTTPDVPAGFVVVPGEWGGRQLQFANEFLCGDEEFGNYDSTTDMMFESADSSEVLVTGSDLFEL